MTRLKLAQKDVSYLAKVARHIAADNIPVMLGRASIQLKRSVKEFSKGNLDETRDNLENLRDEVEEMLDAITGLKRE